ncbi:MAG TPA: HDIG domain-containing protein, partial [Candidatus Limnocylindria bacterium]|nr:HDIG domain-containing protein [Candidatus Limnocylindria bacterium]
IQENQLAMLSSLGLLSRDRTDYAMYAGSVVLVAAILVLMVMSLRFSSAPLYFSIKRLPIVYLTILVTLLLTSWAKSASIPYAAPLALPYLLLSVTLGVLPAVTTGAAVSLVGALMLVNSGGTGADMMNLVISSLFSGLLGAHLLAKRYQRSFLLIAGTAVSLSNFFILLSIGMMTSMSMQQTLDRALWGFAGGAASALLGMALVPALESMFNLPTPMRLLDLTNPIHPLLRRLLLETPGTYHHSIIIANLAEACAEAIGANPLLARAGAYFHDIGKLKRPLYFKENQIGTSNLHDATDPRVSAAIITSHVREGLVLARAHRLPEEIQHIIADHHGNSIVQYFYHKASEEEGAPADEQEYRYDGGLPRSAECAIIMICDTVEAAIRTLSSPTREEIAEFIGTLIRQKMDAGLLDASPLTLRHLQVIRDTCAKVIFGVFHERIEYPKAPVKAAPSERLAAALQGLRKPSRPLEKAGRTAPPQQDGARDTARKDTKSA